MPPKLCPDFTHTVGHCHAKSWLALRAGWWCVARFAGVAQFSPGLISIKPYVLPTLNAGLWLRGAAPS